MKKKLKKKAKRVRTEESTEADGASASDELNDDEDDDGSEKRRAKVDYDEFVATWQSSESVSQVAETLGIQRNSASAIAARLRKAEVSLKKMARRSSQPIDVKRLNKIASGKEVAPRRVARDA